MANLHSKCVLGSYNCRSVKNSTAEVLSLCFQCDIICLQEHWLLPDKLDYISNIHCDFVAVSHSEVDISSSVLVGRPYGSTAIMYRKALSSFITPVETVDARISAVTLCSDIGPVLLCCV